ncbi:MAG: DUF3467 domain-containing protein [Planctomycetota bacterium]|nr:DUF3467 domain-containing protein [Planctomycetota bacterium]
MSDDNNKNDNIAQQLTREAGRLQTPTGPKVKFDDAKMHSSYANVCNISFTREEVLLLFGMSEAWQSGQKEVNVQLTERVILSPFAAKRLQVLLSAIMQQYEQRFGPLEGAIPTPAK